LIQDDDVSEIDTEYLQSQLKKQMEKFKSEKLIEKNDEEISKVLEENELGSKFITKSSQISVIKTNETVAFEEKKAPNSDENSSSSNEEASTEIIDESESDEGNRIVLFSFSYIEFDKIE